MSVKAEETQWPPLEMAVVLEGGGHGEGRGLMLQQDGGLGPVPGVLFTSWDLGQISPPPWDLVSSSFKRELDEVVSCISSSSGIF